MAVTWSVLPRRTSGDAAERPTATTGGGFFPPEPLLVPQPIWMLNRISNRMGFARRKMTLRERPKSDRAMAPLCRLRTQQTTGRKSKKSAGPK